MLLVSNIQSVNGDIINSRAAAHNIDYIFRNAN